MLTQCNQWPLRVSRNAVSMLDVYDGDVWKEFLCVQGRPFLSQSNNLALVLNVDWFRPFERSQYSVGVMYFTILNRPREVRYLPKKYYCCRHYPRPKRARENYEYISSTTCGRFTGFVGRSLHVHAFTSSSYTYPGCSFVHIM